MNVKLRRTLAKEGNLGRQEFYAKLYQIPCWSIGFQRVAVLMIGSVQKEAVDDRRLRILSYLFFKFLALTVRIPLFKRTGHGQTEKWTEKVNLSNKI